MKISSFFLIALLLTPVKSFSATEKDFGVEFSNVARIVNVDYYLLKSIAYASSGFNNLFISINNTDLSPYNRESFDEIISYRQWLFIMGTDNTTETILVNSKEEIFDYVDKFSGARSYTFMKIDKDKIRFGVMAVDHIDLKDTNSSYKNILTGGKKFKSMVDDFGIKNAISLYCNCDNSDKFYSEVSNYYYKISGKDLESTF